jgi:hypothetical protein
MSLKYATKEHGINTDLSYISPIYIDKQHFKMNVTNPDD